MQTTLVILKPDALQRGLAGCILGRLEDKGLQVIGAKMIKISQELAARHYQEHLGKPFYPSLVEFMTHSPVLVLAVYGKQAIEVVREMIGSTTGYEAQPGTVRGDFGSSKTFNLVHASDGQASAKREIELFFEAQELHPYTHQIDKWVLDQ